MNLKLPGFFAFISLLMLLSCRQNTVFENTIQFKDHRWNRFDLLEKDFEIKDITELYDIQLILVNRTSYTYDFISLNITLYFPDETVRSRNIEIRLQDKSLQWIGKEENGFVTTPYTYIKGMRFSQPGRVRIRIENKMSRVDLEGIESLEIVVKKAN